ncbi:hypothetical protein [Butyrivibrio sp. AE3004]|uniref:hypothetical protein n=1 Tax=Butyrivibrio sp. AE3004 TaxID=1506994 RepID=UPI0004945D3A|nr:hypothetical protein [Butyrivibrio sp. AE3004]
MTNAEESRETKNINVSDMEQSTTSSQTELEDDVLENVAGGKVIDNCIKTIIDFALKTKK